jgi:hypothetical protein
MIPTDQAPPVTMRSGGLVVAGMFVVSGFARIFSPHPAAPQTPAQHKTPAVQTQTKTPETETKADPYPVELGEKIRESFGCASPENQPTEHPEKNHWNVPENSRGQIRFLFALEPDPAHTHLALLFDRGVEALELAVQRDGSYAFDRSILPWQSSPHGSGKSDESNKDTGAQPRKLEKYPGLLIFRKSTELSSGTDYAPSSRSCPAKASLFVFLIAETPTSGIRADQFQNALTIMRQIRDGSTVPLEYQSLLLLGPNFSGSLDSLRREIQQIPPDLHISNIAVYSGGVTSQESMARFRAALKDAKRPVRFESFQENDAYAIQMFTSFAASRGYCSSEIAILSEADTAYGNQPPQSSKTSDSNDKESTNEKSSCEWPIDNPKNADERKIVHLHFPREISFFRAAYQKELAAQAQNAAKIPNGKSSLPPETDEEANDDDAVAPFARSQMTQSQEAVMLGIVSELQKHRTKFSILLATNPVDEVFLARYLRSNYPQGRIVVTSPDLLLMKQDDSLLYGVLGLNDYSLVPGIGDSLYQIPDERTTHTDQLFDSSSSVGVFNAATALLFTNPGDPTIRQLVAHQGAPAFADYASPGLPVPLGHRPILWLTILGRDGYWPLAALTEETDPDIVRNSSLPIVPVGTQSTTQSTLPFIVEKLDLPDSSPLHTRPAWNVTYGLCFVLLALHAYLSIYGSFLSNSESKAQFARSDDPLSAAVLAIGAFWLCIFFVLLLCTRSLRFAWDTVCPVGITILLWAPLPIFIAITAYDLKKRCNKPSIVYGFLTATLAVSIFLIALSSGVFPKLQFVWSSRLIHLTSGVSPALPFLLLLAAGYWWAWLSLRSVSIVDMRRPRLPNILSLPRSAVRISESEGEAVRATAHPLAIGWRINGCLIGVLLISISALEWRHPLQSLEGYVYDIGYSVGLAFTIAVFLSCLIRLVFTWFDYKQVLSGLDRTPLREAFSRMKRLSWRSMWNPGGSTLRATYRVMSRILESMPRVKAILSKNEKSSEVLKSIQATEDRLEDVMNDYYALFPLSSEEESFEELLEGIGDTRKKLTEAIKRYSLLFPLDEKVKAIPESRHALEDVQSADQRFSESWNTFTNAFEAAKKMQAIAEIKAAKKRSFFQRFVFKLRQLWEVLSPAKTVQSSPNRGREVIRQIRAAHRRLVEAVSEHDAQLASDPPQEAVSQTAHDSLKKIKAAQSKLIAALDRYAALFPAAGVYNPRGKILLNLTISLGELQQQLANTAGLIYREILTPLWAEERVPSVSEDERLPKVELEVSRAIEEEFVALVYVNFLQSVLLQMRSLVICAGGMYVLLLCSMNVYPFEPHLALQILGVVLIVIMASVVGFVYKEMHSDPILSRLTSTTAGVLGWDFWLKFISAGAIPVFSLLAVQFPEIGRFLFSWLEPALQAVK